MKFVVQISACSVMLILMQHVSYVQTIDEDCTNTEGTSSCQGANEICGADSKCVCDDGYTASDGTCVSDATQACTDDSGCQGANEICGTDKTCVCEDGYTDSGSGTCVSSTSENGASGVVYSTVLALVCLGANVLKY